MSSYGRHFILGAFILSIILLGLAFGPFFLEKARSENIPSSVTVSISICGNNIKELGEECDGSDLNNQTCTTKGFFGSTLGCNLNCASFNTLSCTSGGGGGGGGTYVLALPGTQVIFSGKAYPQSKVTLLKNGQPVATTLAGGDANFEIGLTNISAGSYMFFLYSEDYAGRRSTPMTLPITITDGIVTRVSGIFLAPTIGTDKIEVKKGDNLVIFGQSASNAEVVISVSSEVEEFFKTSSDKNGLYSYNLDTAFLDFGGHMAKSKASISGLISSYGKVASFTVSAKNVFKTGGERTTCDINANGKVDLIDFSIMAYWYKRPQPPREVDLNSDGLVNLLDFSILAYCWTG